MTVSEYARQHGRSWKWAWRRLNGMRTRAEYAADRADPLLAEARANGVSGAAFRMRKSRGWSSEVAAMDWSEVLP